MAVSRPLHISVLAPSTGGRHPSRTNRRPMLEPKRPFSRESVEKKPRIRGATVKHSICPYCAVGCAQLAYVKDGVLLDVEGDPESPINRGTLCPKGAATYQFAVNPLRITQVMYRAPYSEGWAIESLGGATLDNEANYMIKKLLCGGLGIIPIENQARI